MYYLLFIISLSIAVIIAANKPQYFIIFLLTLGPWRIVSPLGNVFGGSLNLASIWVFSIVLLGMGVMIMNGGFNRKFLSFEKAYLIFFIWCFFQISRAPSLAFAIRMFIKLFVPYLSMLLAGSFIRTRKMVVTAFTWIIGMGWVTSLWIGGLTNTLAYPLARLGRIFFSGWAVFSDYTIVISLLCLVCWYMTRQKRYLLLFALSASSVISYNVRTGILGIALGSTIFVLLTQKPHKAVIGIGIAYLSAAFSLFFIPSIKEHMFYKPEKIDSLDIIKNPQEINLDMIDSSGRFLMWEKVNEEMFSKNPWFGQGLGATQEAFYKHRFGSLRVVHNEHLRLLTDLGIIGYSLYLNVVILIMINAWKLFRSGSDVLSRGVALAVLTLLPSILLGMMFDNILDYSIQAGQYPFAFAGMMAFLSKTTGTDTVKQLSAERV